MFDFRIAPSLLSADVARLGEEANAVLDAGADLIHVDVMDNHYVPNLTFGPLVCEGLRKFGINAPLDVHLMTKPVDRLIARFADAGATNIAFHPEASDHVDRSLALIRSYGCKAGLALNPATSLDCLEFVLDKLDYVLVMTVNPGFGGQEFIPSSLDKIRKTRHFLAQSNHSIRLAVDGGIKLDNIRAVAEAGADTFIAGSAIFGKGDYAKTLAAFHAELAKVNPKKLKF